MKKIFITGVAIMATFSVFAQKYTEKQMKSSPVWIQMMDNKQTNYFEAKRAFELYWEGRELPIQENDLFILNNEDKENSSLLQSTRNEKDEDVQAYSFEYKKFKHWLLKNEQFVKADGTIMSATERVEQWKLQQQNRK